MRRCVNLDWLEVYCIEPADGSVRDADYFREAGWRVVERPYGTRQYQQMFTLVDDYSNSVYEIRRAPFVSSTKAMFIDPNGCHIRLSNRSCYSEFAIDNLRTFLAKHGYYCKRIYRLDVCLDFIKFDSGDDPQDFIRRYLKGIYTKINQASLSAHGRDEWHGRSWNSLAWGQLKSDVQTKIYCKTLELAQVKDKPYIRQAWRAAGLIDDEITMLAHKADGTPYKADIWRVEFSIKSSGRKVFVMRQGGQENGRRILMPHTLDCYDTRAKLLAVFAALAEHYFHFKIYKANVRKDRCKDKILFRFSPKDSFYQLETIATATPPTKSEDRLLAKLLEFQATTIDPELFKAAGAIIAYLEEIKQRRQLNDFYCRAELQALQLAISLAVKNKTSMLTAQDIEDVAQLIYKQQVF